jgi:hypothetical protein
MPELKLVSNSLKPKRRRVKKIVDKDIPRVLNNPRARIVDSITLYTNLHTSKDTKDILTCIALAENIEQEAKKLIAEAKAKRNQIVEELGGRID